MNLNVGLVHDVSLSQQLNLAPQMLQWLKLLQVPTTDLSALVQHELESNPVLELAADSPLSASDGDDLHDGIETAPVEAALVNDSSDDFAEKLEWLADIDESWREEDSRQAHEAASNDDANEWYQHRFDSISRTTSLHQHLLDQIPLIPLSSDQQPIAEMIIGSLDERGYLVTPPAEIAGLAGVAESLVLDTLAILQTMDPAGVAARDLQECLLIQVQDPDDNFLPKRLVRDCFQALANRLYADIAARLDVSMESIETAIRHIASLDPEPGRRFDGSEPAYIEPDITIYEKQGRLVIELEDTRVPQVRISSSCRQLLARKTLKPEENAYLRARIRSASFLIQGISQRQETLRRVAEQIVSVQNDFLLHKEAGLQPLTMARVASILGVHETTVSRALAGKYIRTPRGVFEMRYFFRSGYACTDGSALTPESVRQLIREIVQTEDPVSPLRDVDIAQNLHKRGLRVARRTIAKYREELGLPSSKERTQFRSERQSRRQQATSRGSQFSLVTADEPRKVDFLVTGNQLLTAS